MSTPTFTPDPQAQRSAELAALVRWFETITPASVAELPMYYASDAYFKDPFNEVRGLAAIEGIFSHMFVAMHAPRFVVTGQVLQGNQAFLTWDFHFAFRSFQPDAQRLPTRTRQPVQKIERPRPMIGPPAFDQGDCPCQCAAVAGQKLCGKII